jgi:hypothetical protein
VGEVSPLNKLYARFRYKGFEFLTVYVREPHPGENYPHHTSWEQKLQYAMHCRAEDGIVNPLVVDDLEGTVHRAYGVMPNMVYIVDKTGKIAYKAMWTDHQEIEIVIENLALADELAAQGVRMKTSFTEKINYIPATYDPSLRERVFGRAGPKSSSA